LLISFVLGGRWISWISVFRQTGSFAIATSTNMASTVGGGWMKNLKHTRQQLDTVVGTNSCFVKFLCVGVCVGYFLSFSDRAMFSLCVLPGNVLPPNFWIWTYLSHNFVEVS